MAFVFECVCVCVRERERKRERKREREKERERKRGECTQFLKMAESYLETTNDEYRSLLARKQPT